MCFNLIPIKMWVEFTGLEYHTIILQTMRENSLRFSKLAGQKTLEFSAKKLQRLTVPIGGLTDLLFFMASFKRELPDAR